MGEKRGWREWGRQRRVTETDREGGEGETERGVREREKNGGGESGADRYG